MSEEGRKKRSSDRSLLGWSDINWGLTHDALGLSGRYVVLLQSRKLVQFNNLSLWSVPMFQEVKCKGLLEVYAKLVRVVLDPRIKDPDKEMVNERNPEEIGPYLVSVLRERNIGDVGGDMCPRPAKQLLERGVLGCNFPERLLLGLGFAVTNPSEQLDCDIITSCIGSLHKPTGLVPTVHYDRNQDAIVVGLVSSEAQDPKVLPRTFRRADSSLTLNDVGGDRMRFYVRP